MGVLKRRAEPKTDDSILLGRISWTQRSMATLAPVNCWDLVSSFWILKSVNKHRLSCLKLFTLNQVHLKCVLSFLYLLACLDCKKPWERRLCEAFLWAGTLWSGIDRGKGFPSRAAQCYTRGFSSLERSILEIKKKKSYWKIIKKPVGMGRAVW